MDRNMHRELPPEPREPITAEQLAAGRGIRRPLPATSSAVPQFTQPPVAAPTATPAPTQPVAAALPPTPTPPQVPASQLPPATGSVGPVPAAAASIAQMAARQSPPWQPPPVFSVVAPLPTAEEPVAPAPPPAVASPPPPSPPIDEAIHLLVARTLAEHLPTEQQEKLAQVLVFVAAAGMTLRELRALLNDVYG